jgi:hypothetical protein
VARFRHTDDGGGERFSTRPVEAWSSDGDALVVDWRSGQLKPAHSCGGFVDVDLGDGDVVAAVPGGGWRVQLVGKDGSTRTEPVLAWTVNSAGGFEPVGPDSSGYVDSYSGWYRDGEMRFLPPAEDGVE